MDVNDSSAAVISAAIKIHMKLGPGMFERTYQILLERELLNRGLKVESQKRLDIEYEGYRVERAYKVDMVVNDHLVVELKSLEKIAPVHFKQLLTYLRLSGIRIGLLINFGHVTLKAGIHRVANGYGSATHNHTELAANKPE